MPTAGSATVDDIGVAGVAVTDRVLAATTTVDGEGALQSRIYTDTPVAYTVYRDDDGTGEFVTVASGASV